MLSIVIVFQFIIGLGLLNVWIVRFKKVTEYRGGSATNLVEEFATYGLPAWSCYIVGFLKISSAIALIAGFWMPILVKPAAGLVAFLMLGAIAMHLKVKDPLKKSIPALAMLVMSSCVFFLRG